MSEIFSIKKPALLQISNAGSFVFGANQAWYTDPWQQRAGCGPTTASHLLWYLSRRNAEYTSLCPHDAASRPGFLSLMEAVWRYVTPGEMGVNRADIFTDGVVRFGNDRNARLSCRVLEIPAFIGKRPGREAVAQFLAGALADDLPVAFLNLSNGSLKNLDNWHWVTLVSLQPSAMRAEMYDQCLRTKIDLGLWLETTILGGAFVAVEPIS